MKILFFDMEFANGKIPGSIYSFGYVQTNGKWKLTQPQTDILMNPECKFNDYVRKNILAYPLDTVKEASTFPAYYKRLKKLLCRANLVVGFAVGNDTAALFRDCERYRLKPLVFNCLDMERLCKKFPDHKEVHGLSNCVKAWSGTIPDHQHRSDGDAYATMLLFHAICQTKGIAPKDIAKRFSDCMISSIPPTPKEKPKGNKQATDKSESSGTTANGNYRRRRRRRRPSGNRTNVSTTAQSSQNAQAQRQSTRTDHPNDASTDPSDPPSAS